MAQLAAAEVLQQEAEVGRGNAGRDLIPVGGVGAELDPGPGVEIL